MARPVRVFAVTFETECGERTVFIEARKVKQARVWGRARVPTGILVGVDDLGPAGDDSGVGG